MLHSKSELDAIEPLSPNTMSDPRAIYKFEIVFCIVCVLVTPCQRFFMKRKGKAAEDFYKVAEQPILWKAISYVRKFESNLKRAKVYFFALSECTEVCIISNIFYTSIMLHARFQITSRTPFLGPHVFVVLLVSRLVQHILSPHSARSAPRSPVVSIHFMFTWYVCN